MASSTGVKVNWAVPLPSPAGIVSVKSGTASKSASWALPGLTEIVSAVAEELGKPSTVAVTVITAAPPYSRTVSGERLKVAPVGGGSLSVIEISSPVTVRPVEAPVTSMVSVASAIESSAGVRVKLPVPRAAPAAMLMSKFDTAA